MRNFWRFQGVFFAALAAAAATGAQAQELDTVLPDGIPGYGTPFAVVSPKQPKPMPATGFDWSGMTIAPSLSADSGYDSAPDGAAGSASLSASPSLFIADPLLGFGAFAALNATNYPQDNRQNLAGAAVAAGEKAELPEETLTLSAAYLRGQENGFALTSFALTEPVDFTIRDLRASDEITAGVFTLEPEITATSDTFPELPAQTRTDTRETLTASYVPGGPVTLILRLQSTQSDYREGAFNATTNQLLAGWQDSASGLWTFSALAGTAERQPRTGFGITAPVLEARLDWMPAALDRVRISFAREIDDPDEIAAAPYTLTEVNVALAQQYMDDMLLKLTARASNAAYLHSNLRETLYYGEANLSWQFVPGFAVFGDYTFNDRQANYLDAANEHIFTLGFTWTP